MYPPLCSGSGGRCAELVILDTCPGINPYGTCPKCGRFLMMVGLYRMPKHKECKYVSAT